MLRVMGAESPDPPAGLEPVRVTVSDWPRDPPLHLYAVGSEAVLPARHVDGWHRLCSARLAGLTSFPCEAVPENLHDKPIRGAVEEFSLEDNRLQVSGWFLDPDPTLNYELRSGRLILATGAPTERPDVAQALSQDRHARAWGFEIDIEIEAEWGLSPEAHIRFDLVVMREIFPVGLIPILHVPGGSVAEPTLVYQLVRPLVRRRALDALGAVLACRADGVQLGPALERLLPTATVKTIDASDAGGAPPDSADLVIAHGALPGLDRDAQLAFLEELRRVARQGGYVVATLQGELIRPFLTSEDVRGDLDSAGISYGEAPGGATVQTMDYVLDAFGRHFEVVEYVKGGAGNLYDLVLLRNA
jgi:hypothetical protein